MVPRASLIYPWLRETVPRDVVAGTCRLHVHSDEVTVYFVLPPAADPVAAEAALDITGAGEPEVEPLWSVSGEQLFLVRLPAGQPGELVTVRLAGPFGPGGEPVDLGFEFERVTTPRVVMEYRYDGGEWTPVEPGSTLPRRPMELRLRSEGGADIAVIAGYVSGAGLPFERQGGEITIRLDSPPPHLSLNLNGILADHGLTTTRSLLELFTGEEPRLSLLDPVTGQEEALGRAPVNIYRTLVAPSGDRVALMATDPTDLIRTQIWALDVRTGDLHQTGIRLTDWQYRIYWRPGELVVADHDRIHRWQEGMTQAEVQVSRGTAFTALSPDGRLLAGITYDMREEDEHQLAPGSIVLHDLETGEDRILAERQVRVRIPHSEFAPWLELSFSPDGSSLLIREPAPEFGAWRYLRLDLASDSLEEAPDPPAEAQREWVPGPGGFAYRVQDQVYDDVVVLSADGAERQYGSGHVAGWLPDGRLLLVRWANSEWLRYPAGP
ncbi:hypothetical protein [Symbiobacterium terraclitae]|uniref:hypothetical protein n=1 Tax=Symbiobacterium terraclitae TaxID=557451 RepID=UPI0035B533CE